MQTRDQGILLQEGDHQGEQEKLSQILLCLEENIRDRHEVLGQCVAEIKEIRREMMEDYSISPKLVANCCGQGD